MKYYEIKQAFDEIMGLPPMYRREYRDDEYEWSVLELMLSFRDCTDPVEKKTSLNQGYEKINDFPVGGDADDRHGQLVRPEEQGGE